MFRKSDIRRVSIVIPSGEYGSLIVKLGKSRVLHLERELSGIPGMNSGVKSGSVSACARSAEKIISAAVSFYAERGLIREGAYDLHSLTDDLQSLLSRIPEEDLREAIRISRSMEKYKKAVAAVEKQISILEKKLNDIRLLRERGIDFDALDKMKNISYVYGTVAASHRLQDKSSRWFHILHGNRLLLLFPSSDSAEVTKLLKDAGFSEDHGLINDATGACYKEREIEARLDLLKGRAGRLESLFEEGEDGRGERISLLAAVYSVLIKIAGAESDLASTSGLVVISGWINMKDLPDVQELLRISCTAGYYIWVATETENRIYRGRIPVLLRNMAFFRPFELLVRLMGTPGNIEIDPTPAAAIAYTVIFGVMFGDLGQGLIIAAAGAFISWYGRRKHGAANSVSDFGGIMTWCGISAAIFGLLYGSVFSSEHLIPALLFHPMENMMELFLMAIGAGIFFISAGLLFSIINGIMAGHYGEALFGTRGAAGLAVYLSAVYFVIRFVLRGEPLSAGELYLFFSTPALLFAFRGPLEYILFHGERPFPRGLFEYTVESMVEIIEMFSGLLGNTISFIRAGAFALSHAGLSIAVFTLAGIIDPSMRSIGAVAAIITGNIFIILLEGLVCSIQSMRLEYYEFFSKFFKGDGVPFTPFSLDSDR